ncbi:MAG: hypothetical protein QF704_06240 [Anaerolineales bacterium]|nr:hypothetical protein [Anaerolineales bacterium]
MKAANANNVKIFTTWMSLKTPVSRIVRNNFSPMMKPCNAIDALKVAVNVHQKTNAQNVKMDIWHLQPILATVRNAVRTATYAITTNAHSATQITLEHVKEAVSCNVQMEPTTMKCFGSANNAHLSVLNAPITISVLTAWINMS